MCCYLPAFEVADWKKPKNQWCKHCSGHSCNIYAERPDGWREFECMWLMCNILGDQWYPKKSKIIVTSSITGDNYWLVFEVHDHYPSRWRDEPYYSDIKCWVIHGLQSGAWVTKVVVRDQLWIILPNKDILITSETFRVGRRGSNKWNVIQPDTEGNEARKAKRGRSA
jgi:hypothetical protein